VSNPVRPSDKKFLRRFSLVVAGLAVLILSLLALVAIFYDITPAPQASNPLARLQTRITPSEAVKAGLQDKTKKMAGMTGMIGTQSQDSSGQLAFGGSMDGSFIYGRACAVCHDQGIAGAPKLGDQAVWAPRITQGMAVLERHAIDGYHGPDGRFMPAKGGNPALSDAQVRATVQWMVGQAKK